MLYEETPAAATASVSVTRPAWMLLPVVQTAQHPCLTVRVCVHSSTSGSAVNCCFSAKGAEDEDRCYSPVRPDRC
jgi:hypothetical protein